MHLAALEQRKKEKKPSFSAKSEQTGAVVHGNKAEIHTADFIWPMLPSEHVEDFLDDFAMIASYRGWPKSRWVELVQPFLMEEYQEVYRGMYHNRDDYDNFLGAIQSRERWKRSTGRRWSPIATGESLFAERRSYSGDVAQILSEEVCAKVSVDNREGNFVQPAGGDREHKKSVVSSYGCLCEVVSPEKRAQYPASCKGCDQVCGSAVTPGNRKPVWPAGDVGKSKKDAMLPRVHVGALACESTAKKGQRPQLKLSTPVNWNGKTVTNVRETGYETIPCEVGISPVRKIAFRDLQVNTLSSNKAQFEAEPAASLRSGKDLSSGSVLFSRKTSGENEDMLLANAIKNVILHPEMSGVTTEKCVPLPLATMAGVAEVSLETAQELMVSELRVSQDNCVAHRLTSMFHMR